MIEKTLSILKPDATKRNITGSINAKIEASGLRIIAQKRLLLNKAQAEGFYSEHRERSFFTDLINYMTSGAVVIQILEGVDAVDNYRQLMGSTDPKLAKEGSIRQEFGQSIEANSVHGSDSLDSAKREIEYFFKDYEIIG